MCLISNIEASKNYCCMFVCLLQNMFDPFQRLLKMPNLTKGSNLSYQDPGNITDVIKTWWHRKKGLLRFLEKKNASQLPLIFFSPPLFRNYRKLGAKKYFTDHWTANTIQLFVAIKGNFLWSIFFWTSRSEGEFSRDHLINVSTCLFAYHWNRH